MNSTVHDWLLEENNPSINYFTQLSLLNKSPDDPNVLHSKRSIMEKGIVPKILAKQNEDGSWGVRSKFYRDKYRGTAWTLLILAELGVDPDDPRIKKACEFILSHSQEPESGGFSYDQSAKTGFGLSSGIIPCLSGNMVYALVKLGYLEDERVKKAIDWIVRVQRTDDGDTAPTDTIYLRYKTCWGKHSCHMGVAKAFKALTAIPQEKRSDEVNRKINEFAEYFLKHHLFKKSHDLQTISRPGWLKLGFPLMYQTDVLELLNIFAELNIRDDRLNEAIDVIKSKQMPDGTWKLESTNNGRMLVSIETKGLSSKWITLKALKTLAKFE